MAPWRAVPARPPLRFVTTPPRFLRKASRRGDGTFGSGVSTGRGGAQGLTPSLRTGTTVTQGRQGSGSSQEDTPTHQLFQLDDLLLLLVYLLALHLQDLLQTRHVFFQVPIGSQCDLRGAEGKGRSPGANSPGASPAGRLRTEGEALTAPGLVKIPTSFPLGKPLTTQLVGGRGGAESHRH